MEDNSSSDDEVNESTTSRKMSGKKLKLNDGSSQNSTKDAGIIIILNNILAF